MILKVLVTFAVVVCDLLQLTVIWEI